MHRASRAQRHTHMSLLAAARGSRALSLLSHRRLSYCRECPAHRPLLLAASAAQRFSTTNALLTGFLASKSASLPFSSPSPVASHSFHLDPHLAGGLNDIPTARPTLRQHDGISGGAAAGRAVSIRQEEDAINDEETLCRRTRCDGETPRRARQKADARGAHVVDGSRHVCGRVGRNFVQRALDDGKG
eukprot:scaffold10794_cov119-Isochrysis_galbana.AAC.2